MRIDGPSSIGRPHRADPKKGSDGKSFSSLVGDSEATKTPAGFPVSPLASILGIVDEESPEDRRRRTLNEAQSLIDDLEDISRSVSLGTLNPTQLEAISRRIKHIGRVDDPTIADLIGQIEVRVAVEIARYRYPGA